jgi:putative transposase
MPEIARLRESRVSTFKRFEQCRAELKYRKAFADSDGTSGYRRVPRQLPRRGVRADAELVRALTRELAGQAAYPVAGVAGVRRSADMPARWRIEMPVRPIPWPAFITQGG